MTHYVPERGDVVWLNFNPQAGREQAGVRPAVVISDSVYNRKTGLGLFCPVTKRAKGYVYEIRIPAGCADEGVVLCDQVKSLDWRVRLVDVIGELPFPLVADVLDKVHTLVGP